MGRAVAQSSILLLRNYDNPSQRDNLRLETPIRNSQYGNGSFGQK